MKTVWVLLVLLVAVAPAFAQKPCEELKSEIVTKLEAKGVKNYKLEIWANEEIKDQKIIGSCEGGKKKITYKKDGRELEIRATQAGPIRHPPLPPPPRPNGKGKPPKKPPTTKPGVPGKNSPLPPRRPPPSNN